MEPLTSVLSSSLPVHIINERIQAGGLCQSAQDAGIIDHAIFVWEGHKAKPLPRGLAVSKATMLEHVLTANPTLREVPIGANPDPLHGSPFQRRKSAEREAREDSL